MTKALQEVEDIIATQRDTLEMANIYMKETEAIGIKSWELLTKFRGFLTSLSVISTEPNHDTRDGLASIHWIASCLSAMKAVVTQWGHHCVRVAWTGAFNAIKSIAPLSLHQIKEALRQLSTACGKDYAAFKHVQAKVMGVDHYFRHELCGPSGLDLARSTALEAAREALARTSMTAPRAGSSADHEEGPSTRDINVAATA